MSESEGDQVTDDETGMYWSIAHPDGRSLRLMRFSMWRTYEGVIEGSRESATRAMMPGLRERSLARIGVSLPVVVIGPSSARAPEWTCVAHLESNRAVASDDPDYCSRLAVVWFVDSKARSVNDMIEAIAPDVDWAGHAEDFDVMNF